MTWLDYDTCERYPNIVAPHHRLKPSVFVHVMELYLLKVSFGVPLTNFESLRNMEWYLTKRGHFMYRSLNFGVTYPSSQHRIRMPPRCDLGLVESRDASQLIDGHVSGLGVVEDVGSRSSDRRFVTVDCSEIPFPTTVWMCRNTSFQL